MLWRYLDTEVSSLLPDPSCDPNEVLDFEATSKMSCPEITNGFAIENDEEEKASDLVFEFRWHCQNQEDADEATELSSNILGSALKILGGNP